MTVEVSATIENQLNEALKTLDGGHKYTNSHIAIAAYPKGESVYFV